MRPNRHELEYKRKVTYIVNGLLNARIPGVAIKYRRELATQIANAMHESFYAGIDLAEKALGEELRQSNRTLEQLNQRIVKLTELAKA